MSLEDMIRKIRLECGALALAVVSRDGVIITADIPPEVSKDTFSIMCATILGAGMTAANELGKGAPSRIILESPDVEIIIFESGRRSMVVAVMPPGSDPNRLESQLEEFTSIVSSQV